MRKLAKCKNDLGMPPKKLEAMCCRSLVKLKIVPLPITVRNGDSGPVVHAVVMKLHVGWINIL